MILTISIPFGSQIKVKAGDKIHLKTPLFESASMAEHSIAVAQKLGVEPSKIFHYLKKFVGEEVKKDEVLAVKKGLLSTKRVVSDYEGKIKEIDHSEGHVIITSKGKKNTAHAQIVGEVAELKNQQIAVKVKEGKAFDLKKASGDFGGEAFYWKNTESVTVSNLEIANKVLVSEVISSYTQSKMEALDIEGYVFLNKLPEETTLPFCQIKTIEEFSTIMKHIYPYCYVDSKSGKIVFYK
jgi:hypothetical protein